MIIKNTKVYGLDESIIRSGYPHQIGEPNDLYANDGNPLLIPGNASIDRSKRLANTPIGSGHNNYLKGIIVQFDIRYPQYFTPQLQRYHWIDIISSQSKMHSLTKVKDIKASCNKYVLDTVIQGINHMIRQYNENVFPCEITDYIIINGNGGLYKHVVETKEEMFQYIISNLPMGFELWMGISTNYLQLKTIYNQRKTHKLKEDWGYFCNWIESLPFAQELILV
jgi:hypothetical protein